MQLMRSHSFFKIRFKNNLNYKIKIYNKSYLLYRILEIQSNIFTNKMLYTRSPLKERQNDYKNFRKTYHAKEQIQRQSLYKNDKYIRKTGHRQVNKINSSPYNQKHSHHKSQIQFQPQVSNQQRNDNSLLKSARNQKDISILSKGKPYTQERKFNAKQSQIECKINKIQNYQQKIENLLDFVRTKTPLKNNVKTHSQILSRSSSKISYFPQKKQNSYLYVKSPSKIQMKKSFQDQQQKTKSFLKSERSTFKYQNQRRNKYFRPQKQIIQQSRRKSKQYMKSIQGQVNQIKHTVQMLNQRISKNDHYHFKREINFDEISTSNPQSEKRIFEQQKDKNEYLPFKKFKQGDECQEPYKYVDSKGKYPLKYVQYKMRNKDRSQIGILKTPQRKRYQDDSLKKSGQIYKA